MFIYIYYVYDLMASSGGGIMCLVGNPYNQVVSLSRTRYLHSYTVPLRLLLYLGVMHLSAVLLHGVSLKATVFMLLPEFFVHQIITAHNVHTTGFWTTLFTGGASSAT